MRHVIVSASAYIVLFLLIFVSSPSTFAQSLTIQPKLGPLKCNANADDTAIWIHPTNKAKSLIFGTDKDAGFCIWDLQGNRVDTEPLTTSLNNGSVVYNFNFGGQNTDVFVANLRGLGKIGVWKINHDWTINNVVTQLAGPTSSGTSISSDSYGWACWRNPSTTDLECFDKSKSSAPIKHWKISGAQGVVTSTFMRNLNTDVGINVAEGFVVNTASKKIYVNEENPAQTHIYYADASLTPKTRLSVIQGNGLTPDYEGAAIYQCGNGNGYLVSSNQGASNFKVFDLQTNTLVRTFTAQGSSGTDSLDVTSASVPGYPNGFLAIHNDPGADYRIYDWSDLQLNNCPDGYLADVGGGAPQPTSPQPTSAPLLCDINNDGCCNLVEYNAVHANYGRQTNIGDLNGDSIVNLIDWNLVHAQYGVCRAQ